MDTRNSIARRPNSKLKRVARGAPSGNAEFIESSGVTNGVVLYGGVSVSDFRQRAAQSRLRHDMTPSHWSHAAILLNGRTLFGVSLDTIKDTSGLPGKNGISSMSVRTIDNSKKYPNVAVIEFSLNSTGLRNAIRVLEGQRSAIDIPEMMVRWFGYLWGVPDFNNPLSSSVGHPSAAFVEYVFADTGIDLTPGLVSGASSPEAIWQAARWWHEYYQASSSDEATGMLTPQVPTGRYVIRQSNAAIVAD